MAPNTSATAWDGGQHTIKIALYNTYKFIYVPAIVSYVIVD